MMVLAAEPGMGKTTLTMQLGMDAAATHADAGLIYISLEMSKEEIVARFLAQLAGFGYREMVLRRDWDREKEAKYADAEASVRAMSRKLRIIDGKDLGILRMDEGSSWHDPVSEIVSKTLADLGLREAVIVVDNLQALAVEGPWAQDMDRDRAVIEGLNAIHHETGCTVLVVSETTKESFGASAGMKSVLGTGRIVYRADAVLTMTRPKGEDCGGDDPASIVVLDIVKGRDGVDRKKVRLYWDQHHTKLSEGKSEARGNR